MAILSRRENGLHTLSAHTEAAGHFTQALALLADLPEGPERDRLEFPVQFNLGRVFTAINGEGSQAAEVAFGRALALGRQLGDIHQLAQGAAYPDPSCAVSYRDGSGPGLR